MRGSRVGTTGRVPEKGKLLLWDPETPVLHQAINAHRALVSKLALAPDVCTLARASFDRTVKHRTTHPSGRASVPPEAPRRCHPRRSCRLK